MYLYVYIYTQYSRFDVRAVMNIGQRPFQARALHAHALVWQEPQHACPCRFSCFFPRSDEGTRKNHTHETTCIQRRFLEHLP